MVVVVGARSMQSMLILRGSEGMSSRKILKLRCQEIEFAVVFVVNQIPVLLILF